ncbi:hypothetical protein EM308_09625 [Flavobacterium gilvum]|uniref:Recombinase domain-containing protein n=1 Tax=Flavobacterium gilvum TaxID=1492737 RepID=A0AAC9I513_9FLAO|nr:hypothetical protein EM308_09625 [Flavobacterium gilvum]KFC60402.1 hypothetical protein FEM08_08790 [Flavobacterium gilvum]
MVNLYWKEVVNLTVFSNEDEAEHVRKIFQWKLEGLGNYIIAKKLIESKVPTRQNSNWRGVTVDGIIKNKIYKGIREWNKDDLENYFEVNLDKYIIDPELWDKVNKVYKENIKNVGKKQQFNYLLDDILYCGKCGQKYFGKKRVQSTDSSYRCRGMVKFANHVCRDNRGVNIEKMDTFVIKHLFENKSLKELLINAPKNEGELSVLRQNLADLTKKKDAEIKNKNKLYKLLSNPDLEYDDQLINDYTKSKNKLGKLTDEINELSQKIAEVGNLKRNDLTKTLIESYTKDIDFGILKKLVNSLIERIEIDYDRKPSSHGGVFQFKIKYKNFEESSLFMSKSTLYEYFWIGYNRTQSITPEDLEEDREMEKGILSYKFKINSEEDYLNYLKENSLELKDEENPWSKNFIGNEISTSMNEKIIFTKEELINVN